MKHRVESAKLRIMFGHEIAIGPGKADLLDAIAATGSISASARRMRMSYRRAWKLVAVMNVCFKEPLVDTATGGEHGGGTRLTPFGVAVLKHYRAMQDNAARAVAADAESFALLLSRTPPAR